MSILRLKEVLKEKEVTGKDLAEKVGLSETAMSNIVKGQSLPRQEVLLKIAQTLDVDIRELFYPTKESTATLEDIQKAIDILERLKKDLE